MTELFPNILKGICMACVKTTTNGKLVVELFSGKILSATELAELDVNWQFFTSLVRHVKNSLAELPQTPLWQEIQDRLLKLNVEEHVSGRILLFLC